MNFLNYPLELINNPAVRPINDLNYIVNFHTVKFMAKHIKI